MFRILMLATAASGVIAAIHINWLIKGDLDPQADSDFFAALSNRSVLILSIVTFVGGLATLMAFLS